MGNFNLDNYIPVNERLGLFYKDFPNGRITTELIQHDIESGFVMFKASAFRDREDADPSSTGHAFEEKTQGYVNKTSYIENCETSAVGRALALLGYEITKGIASREEMAKVQRHQNPENKPQPARPAQNAPKSAPAEQQTGYLSDKQSKAIWAIAKSKGVDETEVIEELFLNMIKGELTMKQAGDVIEYLTKEL